jgi:hypothetical protein
MGSGFDAEHIAIHRDDQNLAKAGCPVAGLRRERRFHKREPALHICEPVISKRGRQRCKSGYSRPEIQGQESLI